MSGQAFLLQLALVLGALATGKTRIADPAGGNDARVVALALSRLGVPVSRSADTWNVTGRGVGGLARPAGPLELGRSKSAMHLIAGAIAGQSLTAQLKGNFGSMVQCVGEQLQPLRALGLDFAESNGVAGQINLTGSFHLLPSVHDVHDEPEHVVAALLIAGLAAAGTTTVLCATPHGDLVRLLRQFGADIEVESRGSGAAITVQGEAELAGIDLTNPM